MLITSCQSEHLEIMWVTSSAQAHLVGFLIGFFFATR